MSWNVFNTNQYISSWCDALVRKYPPSATFQQPLWISSAKRMIKTTAFSKFGIKIPHGLSDVLHEAWRVRSYRVVSLNLALFQYKDHLSRFRNSFYKYKTVVRPSYLYNVNPYIDKTLTLYWGGSCASQLSNNYFQYSLLQQHSVQNVFFSAILIGSTHQITTTQSKLVTCSKFGMWFTLES